MEVLLILLGIFSSSFLIALSGALMPGPLLTITITEASRRGFWAGPLIILGHGLLEFTLLVLLLLGVGAVVNQPYIMGGVALLGAGLLWWMGLGLLKEARQAQLSLNQNHSRSMHPVWAGILMSVANPYWLIWWLTLGLGYVMFAYKYGFWGIAFFFAGHILADLAWYTLVSLAVVQGKHFLSDRLYHGFMVFCALFLIGFGCYFGFQGVRMCWFS
ncbi:MAG: LysE family transporter [Desulfobacca sp.]|nr:LysE family transporter [Desulfobacca sp.]